MKLPSKLICKPSLPYIFALLFSLRVTLPVFVPSLRFGVLKGAAFLLEKLTGHSVRAFIYEISLLAIKMVKAASTLPRSLYTKGFSRTLTAFIGAVEACMNNAMPYIFTVALPSAVIAVGFWIYLFTRKRKCPNISVLKLSHAIILLRAVLTAFLLPVLLYAGHWLSGKTDSRVIAAFSVIAPIIAVIGLLYHIKLFYCIGNTAYAATGREPKPYPISAALISIAAGVTEMLPKLADIRYYGSEAVLAVICGSAYIVFGTAIVCSRIKSNIVKSGLPK